VADDDELAGSARLRIDLDDTGVLADATALGRRIKTALERGARGIGNTVRRDIQKALRKAIKVRVAPDLRGFDRQLVTGLSHIDSLNITTLPDTRRFMARLRAALRGEEVAIRVVPDLGQFDDRIRGHRPPPIPARVDADSDTTRRLSAALGGLGAALGIVGRVTVLTAAIGLLGGAAAASAAQLLVLARWLRPQASSPRFPPQWLARWWRSGRCAWPSWASGMRSARP
jgi:hypothetical protein